jgi:HEAT repeat protein
MVVLALLALIVGRAPAFAQGYVSSSGFLAAGSMESALESDDQQSREDELYNDGTEYLDESNWEAALDKFRQAADLGGKKADGSLFWEAYALNKLGRRDQALTMIADLRKRHPRSNWLPDASALEVEIRQAAGKPANPQNHNDDDIKILALNSLMDSDPKRAIPQVQKILDSSNSPKVKAHALFVLAQSDSPEAQQVLLNVVRGQSHPDLQRKAIEYLATQGSQKQIAALAEVYRTVTDRSVREAVLNAYVACDCRKELLAAAQQERDPGLRRAAIERLGAAGGRDELRQLFKSTTSAEDKEAIINGFVAAGDEEGLSEAARNASDPKVRAAAIRALGAVGGKQSKTTLLQMYAGEKNLEIKRAIIEGLFIQDDAHDLIELDRRETDHEMHRHLVQQLSVMDDKEAKEYMLEILNK